MIDKLTRLAVDYARAHEDLQKEKQKLREAKIDVTEDAFDGDKAAGKINMYVNDGKRWFQVRTGNPVTDDDELAAIANWEQAHAARVTAGRRLTSLRAAILRAGRRLIREGAR